MSTPREHRFAARPLPAAAVHEARRVPPPLVPRGPGEEEEEPRGEAAVRHPLGLGPLLPPDALPQPIEHGVIGLGEPPVISTAAAVGNAVANAIGVRVRSLPLTPAAVLGALERERAGGTL